MTAASDGVIPHEYVPSNLGHSQVVCKWCHGTPAENAVLGPNHCAKRTTNFTPESAAGAGESGVERPRFSLIQIREELRLLDRIGGLGHRAHDVLHEAVKTIDAVIVEHAENVAIITRLQDEARPTPGNHWGARSGEIKCWDHEIRAADCAKCQSESPPAASHAWRSEASAEHQRLASIRDGAGLDEVYGREWCFDRASQFRADLAVALAAPTANMAGEDERVEAVRQQIINSPETADFVAGVPIEAAHQRERWGAEHDAGKSPFDWFWLIGYLAQKAADAAVRGEREKALHHTISTGAALANWHAAIAGKSTSMRPGIEPPKHVVRAAQGDGDLSRALQAGTGL